MWLGYVDPKGISKLVEEVAKVLMDPNPTTLPPSSYPAPMVSWEVPSNQQRKGIFRTGL